MWSVQPLMKERKEKKRKGEKRKERAKGVVWLSIFELAFSSEI